MSRRLTPEERRARGERRPSRDKRVVPLYPDHMSRPDPDVLEPPKGMTAAGRRIWNDKVERYRQRGQKVQGFEDSLRMYCELEATLYASWKTPTGPAMAQVNAHRLWSHEFFDSPASQQVTTHRPKSANAFRNNGRPRNPTA
jgi:streptogramin lyase